MIEILPIIKCPVWLKYPQKYLDLVANEKEEFLPWYLTDVEDFFWRIDGLKKRYPLRNLFPFARKDCSDDVACWEKDQGEKIMIIHDYASSGWEQREIFDNFEEWYEWALRQREEY